MKSHADSGFLPDSRRLRPVGWRGGAPAGAPLHPPPDMPYPHPLSVQHTVVFTYTPLHPPPDIPYPHPLSVQHTVVFTYIC